MNLSMVGRLFVTLGLGFLTLGVVLLLLGRLNWPTRLPGDIVYRRGSFTLFFPLATSLILSVLLSLVFLALGRR